MTQAACVLCGVLVPEDASRCPACGGDLHVAERTLPPGTTLHDGKFNIGRVLGEGGFGITYKGVHTDLRRVVAIKEFFPTALGTGRTGNRVTVSASRKAAFDREQEGVLEEARTIAGLHCTSIVEVYDVFRENGTVYIVLEYLEGQTLAERIQQAGRLAEADVASIGHALCDALEVIHAHRLLHRDVKPANVLLTREGRTVLIDFGSARAYRPDHTVQHTRVLTEEYAAPEQYSDRARFGPYTDIFCLGATLYHALVGVPPPGALIRLQNINPEVTFPHGRHGALYPAVQRALALRAEDRPATVADFRRLFTADARDAQRDGVPTAPDTQPPSPRVEPVDPPIPADLSADPLAYRYCSKGQSFWIIGLAIFYYLGGILLLPLLLGWDLVSVLLSGSAVWFFLASEIFFSLEVYLEVYNVWFWLCAAGLFWIMPTVIAHKKGRRGWLWFVYGIVLGLAALLLSILIPPSGSSSGTARSKSA